MINWLIHLFANAGVLFLAGRAMTSVHVRNFRTALLVALFVGVMSILIGWLLEFVLHLATLGLFYFTGLGLVIRIIVNAIIIEIADQMSSGFDTDGFWPSLWLAIILAITGSVVDAIFF
jgi:putative membrane protein